VMLQKGQQHRAGMGVPELRQIGDRRA
jgi:hypothetical protein